MSTTEDPAGEVRKIVGWKTPTLMLLFSILCGVGGALLVGDSLHRFARIVFNLSTEPYTVFILPVIFLVAASITGTIVLILAFFVENKKFKWWIIFTSVGLPILIEIVDLTVRGGLLINEITTHYGQYL